MLNERNEFLVECVRHGSEGSNEVKTKLKAREQCWLGGARLSTDEANRLL